VRVEAEKHHWRYEVVGGREEGMLLYLRRSHFMKPVDAQRVWQAGQLDALVVRNQPLRDWRALLPGAQLLLISEKSADLPQYSLFARSGESVR
jgi:hypothetical protein